MDLKHPIVRKALVHYKDKLASLMKKAEQAGHEKAAHEVKMTMLQLDSLLGKLTHDEK
jgi:hypothetical protein